MFRFTTTISLVYTDFGRKLVRFCEDEAIMCAKSSQYPNYYYRSIWHLCMCASHQVELTCLESVQLLFPSQWRYILRYKSDLLCLSVCLSVCHELNVSINTYYTGDKVSIIDFENHEWTKHGDKRTVKR